MKKSIILYPIAIIIPFLAVSCEKKSTVSAPSEKTLPTSEGKVNIPDSKRPDSDLVFTEERPVIWHQAVKGSVVKLIGKIPKDMTFGDIRSITDLTVDSKNVTTLNGIELFENLRSLSANNNRIVSLECPRSLSQVL